MALGNHFVNVSNGSEEINEVSLSMNNESLETKNVKSDSIEVSIYIISNFLSGEKFFCFAGSFFGRSQHWFGKKKL
jgi:hypothetical protein